MKLILQQFFNNLTEIEFHKELDKLLDVLEVDGPFYLVVQVGMNSHKTFTSLTDVCGKYSCSMIYLLIIG